MDYLMQLFNAPPGAVIETTMDEVTAHEKTSWSGSSSTSFTIGVAAGDIVIFWAYVSSGSAVGPDMKIHYDEVIV